MNEEIKAQEVIEEIKNADEETLKSTIEKWYESTRMDGIKIGARYISAAIYGKIQKHLNKNSKPSLRDYERCMKDIKNILFVQLTEQNDLKEENNNDGTTK